MTAASLGKFRVSLMREEKQVTSKKYAWESGKWGAASLLKPFAEDSGHVNRGHPMS